MKIIKAKDYNEMSRIVANIVSAHIILYPQSVIGLATGDTPKGMYKQLIKWHEKGDLDFSKMRSVNLDEYIGLSQNHNQSYSWFMWNYFFRHININSENVFIPNGLEVDVQKECERYEQTIEMLGGIDLQVLGIGHNGHIGFNEPGKVFKKKTHIVSLAEQTIVANSRFFNNIEEMPKKAITMGMGTIMQAETVLLICSGEEKSEILHQALYGDINPIVPASVLQLHKNLIVVADEKALRFND